MLCRCESDATPGRPHRRNGEEDTIRRFESAGGATHPVTTTPEGFGGFEVRRSRRAAGFRGDPHRAALAPHEGIVAGFGRGASGPGRSNRLAGGSCRGRRQFAGGGPESGCRFAGPGHGDSRNAPVRRGEVATRVSPTHEGPVRRRRVDGRKANSPAGGNSDGRADSRAKGNNQRSTTGGWVLDLTPRGARRAIGGATRGALAFLLARCARVCPWTRLVRLAALASCGCGAGPWPGSLRSGGSLRSRSRGAVLLARCARVCPWTRLVRLAALASCGCGAGPWPGSLRSGGSLRSRSRAPCCWLASLASAPGPVLLARFGPTNVRGRTFMP